MNDFKKSLRATARIGIDNRGTKPEKAVKIEIFYDRKTMRYPTGVYLTLEEWKKLQSGNFRDKNLSGIRDHLESERVRAAKVIAKIGGNFNFDEFSYRYAGKTPPALKDRQSVYTGFENYIEELEKEQRYGMVKSMSCSMRSFMKYSQELTYKDVTVKFLEDYERFMLADGCSRTTIGMYCRDLRTIFNIARNRDRIIPREPYPFGQKKDHKYEIPTGANVKKSMRKDEIARVLKYDTSSHGDELYINLFQFSVRCNGMNMADIFELRNENIQGDYLVFERQKTKNTRKTPEPIRIFITDDVWEILNRWRATDTDPKAYAFPIYKPTMTEKQKFTRRYDKVKDVNDALKRLRAELGIETELTTYTARHSWASLMNANNINILEISKGLGHTSIATTEKYLSSLDNEEKKRMGAVLNDLLLDDIPRAETPVQDERPKVRPPIRKKGIRMR